MSAIDANRKAQIESWVTNAVNKKIDSISNVKTAADTDEAKNFSVSIFMDNEMSAAEKEFAYKLYSEKMLKTYYDTDKSGDITVKEFAQVEYNNSKKIAEGQREFEIAERSAYFFAEQVDINGDGLISTDEFTYFQKSADKADSKQDGTIHTSGEQFMVESMTGIDAQNKTVKKISEKYLLGNNLTKEEQEYLNQAAENIRNAEALDASKTFGMIFDSTAPKEIYRGDASPYTDETDDTKTETDTPEFVDETKEEETVPAFEDKTKPEATPTFTDKSKYTLSGLNQNSVNPWNMYGGAAYTQPKPNKLFQLGNIIGNAFNLVFMGKMMFGHNGIFGQNDSMGGLRWWF